MEEKVRPILEGLESLETDLISWRVRIGDPSIRKGLAKWLEEMEAYRFHLKTDKETPCVVAILGGTGTGKSTLTNRLLKKEISATSFRRTFTGGAIAVTHPTNPIEEGWLGIPHLPAEEEEPLRGQEGKLCVAVLEDDLLRSVILVDTPDVDGDAETHAEQADRVFRWSHAVVFLVTPEKYQMTELLPYYELCHRYEIPSLFVLNKCEEDGVVEDYLAQLREKGFDHATLFSFPREDSSARPLENRVLSDLRREIGNLPVKRAFGQSEGNRRRGLDLLRHLNDRIVIPLREDLATVERLQETLAAFVTPDPQVDVSPLTAELRERMQSRSILYLMGPKRIYERVKKVSSAVLNRIDPSRSWFGRRAGRKPERGETVEVEALPDFHALLVDQFEVGQSHIRDILENHPRSRRWLEESEEDLWLDPEEAGRIADEEIAQLNEWLRERWEAAPRDTRAILRLLSHIPGGKRVVEWSEASPYLLVVAAAAYNSFLGPIDLLVIGGYSLATWLGEKLSNEVTQRVRETNRALYRRFEQLMREQVQIQVGWLSRQVPSRRSIESVEVEVERIEEVLEAR